MTCGFLRQGLKVLYLGNEDPAAAMLQRFYSNMSGMDRAAMLANPLKAKRAAMDNGFGNLIFYDATPGSIYDVNKKLDQYEPDIMVIDQMANMDTKATYTKVEKNEILASKLRSIAKKRDIVSMIIHQGSDSAYGKLVLEKNDMYFTNVGVQGQMDLMIGIGMDDAYHAQDRRMLCLTKNKINSNHANIPVKFHPLTSQVFDEAGD